MFFKRVNEKYRIKEKIMNVKKNIPCTAFVFSVLAMILLGIIVKYRFGLIAVPSGHKDTPEIVLPILVMIGAVCLLASLAFVAGGFAALGLSDHRYALSLPEGSVRALIALLLLSLFVITSIHLYNRLRDPFTDATVTQYTGISETQLAKIPPDQIISIRVRTEEEAQDAEKVFDVEGRLPGVETTEESQRFAQQILTSVSTLVIAVAGFYFGTRSVAVARGDTASSMSAIIDTINPPEGTKDPTKSIEMSIEIFGKNLAQTKTVKLVAVNSNEIEAKVIKCSDTRIECKLVIPKDQAVGLYSLILVNEDGGETLKPAVFTVK